MRHFYSFLSFLWRHLRKKNLVLLLSRLYWKSPVFDLLSSDFVKFRPKLTNIWYLWLKNLFPPRIYDFSIYCMYRAQTRFSDIWMIENKIFFSQMPSQKRQKWIKMTQKTPFFNDLSSCFYKMKNSGNFEKYSVTGRFHEKSDKKTCFLSTFFDKKS